MTKSDLVRAMSLKVKSLSFQEMDLIVDSVFSKMTQALAKGDRIEIRGFGSFEIRIRPSRQGRNPKSGKQVFVETRRVPFFKVGKELRERINETSEMPMSYDLDLGKEA